MLWARVASQYLVGSSSPSDPFDQKPLHVPALAEPVIAMCRMHAQSGEAGRQTPACAFAPHDLAPGACRQAKGECLDRDRLALTIAPQAFRRLSSPRPRLRHQRCRARCPDRGVRLNARDIAQSERADRRPQPGIAAVASIHQHDAAGNIGRARCADLRPALSQAWSGRRWCRERPTCAGALRLTPTLAASRGDGRSASSLGDWPATASLRLGNCPACRAGRSTGAPHRPNDALSSGSLCHRSIHERDAYALTVAEENVG